MEFWKDSENEKPLPQGLANILEEISELDKRKEVVKADLKRIEARRTRLEELAVEEMSSGGLDGVKVAGRSWRVEPWHHLSVPTDRRGDFMKAAKAMGMDTECLTQVNIARLRAMLGEAAKEAGTDARLPFTAGTPMDGLVGEYVEHKLRHRSS